MLPLFRVQVAEQFRVLKRLRLGVSTLVSAVRQAPIASLRRRSIIGTADGQFPDRCATIAWVWVSLPELILSAVELFPRRDSTLCGCWAARIGAQVAAHFGHLRVATSLLTDRYGAGAGDLSPTLQPNCPPEPVATICNGLVAGPRGTMALRRVRSHGGARSGFDRTDRASMLLSFELSYKKFAWPRCADPHSSVHPRGSASGS